MFLNKIVEIVSCKEIKTTSSRYVEGSSLDQLKV